MQIKNMFSLMVLDSRGNPTLMTKIILSNGEKVSAIVPSGASTGKKEALELRDGDKKKFKGKSVFNAIQNVNDIIAPVFIGEELDDFTRLDRKLLLLDETKNKSNLGANAILSVSIALLKAVALTKKMEIYDYIKKELMGDKTDLYHAPIPMLNLINGGAHANNSLDFQEFMIVPQKASSFFQAIKISAEIFYELEAFIKQKKLSTSKGDEGGFAPDLPSIEEALKLLTRAIKKAKYTPDSTEGVGIAIDVAANELSDNSIYIFKKAISNNSNFSQLTYTSEELLQYYKELIELFPIVSIEDGFAENDLQGFAQFNKECSIMNVGDDLYCTNLHYLKEYSKMNLTNAILIKPNQIGSITETIETIKFAQSKKMKIIVSHRSGDTEDTFIADLSIGVSADYIKTGSLSRSERVSKYNRILEIENELKDKLIYGKN
ncbi:phosphopyruvate hydratase [Ureaplasma canigenitalium]|uniref:phosphopyruvate hydratase n=1 Tax=Ureaplasma canigenitalium TaxID=42092 RepID=UPI0004E11525|nr:phosphopyruvate hydratase [Ureaplasma canigenitalium]